MLEGTVGRTNAGLMPGGRRPWYNHAPHVELNCRRQAPAAGPEPADCFASAWPAVGISASYRLSPRIDRRHEAKALERQGDQHFLRAA